MTDTFHHEGSESLCFFQTGKFFGICHKK